MGDWRRRWPAHAIDDDDGADDDVGDVDPDDVGENERVTTMAALTTVRALTSSYTRRPRRHSQHHPMRRHRRRCPMHNDRPTAVVVVGTTYTIALQAAWAA